VTALELIPQALRPKPTDLYAGLTAQGTGDGSSLANRMSAATAFSSTIVAHRTVWFAGGTYGLYRVELATSGAPGSPTIFRAFPGDSVIFDGISNADSAAASVLNLFDTHDVVFWDLRVTCSGGSNRRALSTTERISPFAIGTNGPGNTRITLRNVWADNAGHLLVNGGGGGFTWEGGGVWNSGVANATPAPIHSIYAQNRAANQLNTLRALTFSGSAGYHIHLWESPHGGLPTANHHWRINGVVALGAGHLGRRSSVGISVPGAWGELIVGADPNGSATGPGTHGIDDVRIDRVLLAHETVPAGACCANDGIFQGGYGPARVTNASLTNSILVGERPVYNYAFSGAFSLTGNVQQVEGSAPQPMSSFSEAYGFMPGGIVGVWNEAGNVPVAAVQVPAGFLADGMRYDIRSAEDPSGAPINPSPLTFSATAGTVSIPLGARPAAVPVNFPGSSQWVPGPKGGGFIIQPRSF
jgi:hypothetical protein